MRLTICPFHLPRRVQDRLGRADNSARTASSVGSARSASPEGPVRVALLTAVLLSVAALGTPLSSALAYEFFWGNPVPQGNPLQAITMIDGTTGVAVGQAGAVLRTTDAGTTWVDLTDWNSIAPDFYDAIALPNGSLLAVGAAPGIFRSDDAGATWSEVPNPSTATLREISHVEGDIYSIVGDQEDVLRSTDAGVSWSIQPSPGSSGAFDQFWIDAANGYVIGQFLARHTTDGGASWLPLPGFVEQPFSGGDVRFLGDDGWILVDFTTWRTTDGGASWFEKHGPFGQGPIYQSECWVESPSTRWVLTSLEGAQVWRTADDGLSWDLLQERQSTAGYTDLTRLESGRFLAVSTDGDLIRSDDGGVTWTNFTRSPDDGERYRLYEVFSRGDGRCYAGGAGTTWLTSSDDGRSWERPPFAPVIGTIWAIAFRGDLGLVGGFVSGGVSQVARTTDDGASWSVVPLSSSNVGAVVSLSFPSDEVAWAATYGGSSINHVLRTTDGGVSWDLREAGLPVNVRFESIFFLDEDTGFLCGANFGQPWIWKTTDGGAVWTALANEGLGGGPRDMHWFDETTGVVLAGNLYRTTDGGANWSSVGTGGYNQLVFENTQHGYANTFYRRILETNDGGITWAEVPLPFVPFIFGLAATPSGFLVAGEQSSIFGGTLDAAAAPEGSGPESLDQVSTDTLERFDVTVRPTPARTRARFQFESSASGTATVEVYDLRGRRVDAWSETVDRGPTTLRWENGRSGVSGRGSRVGAGPLPAGVYLVRVVDPTGREGDGRIVVLP